jgi:MATE family multidrug resistance protein
MVTLMSILLVPLQIFFYYAFLFGKFGFPKFGLAGIGHAFTVSYCLPIVFFFCYLHFSKQLKPYRLFHKWWVVNRKFLFELIRVGLPLGLTFGIEIGLFAAIAIMMGVLGTTALAAHQIAYQYFMLALSFLFALTQTTAIRVGNEVGRNNRSALKLAATVNMGIGFGFMLLFSVFYIFFPHTAIGLDVDIHAPHLQKLIQEASVLLSIAGVLILTDCLRLISSGALRGLKDTRFPMFVSIFGFWCIAFPLAYFLAFKLKCGGAGIWWGLVIGLFIAGVILFLRFNRMAKHLELASLVTKAE